MHVKITTSGGRRYVQLVESYRDLTGRVKKKRTVATLGRTEQVDGALDSVINGLLKITGREPMGAKPSAPSVSYEVFDGNAADEDAAAHTHQGPRTFPFGEASGAGG